MSVISDIINSITGNLATDLTKSLTRRVGNTALIRRLRESFNPDRLSPEVQTLLEDALSEAFRDAKDITPVQWQPILMHPENREQLVGWILEWQETTKPDIGEWSLENAPNPEVLRGFLTHLYNIIQEKKRQHFRPDFFNILGKLIELQSTVDNITHYVFTLREHLDMLFH